MGVTFKIVELEQHFGEPCENGARMPDGPCYVCGELWGKEGLRRAMIPLELVLEAHEWSKLKEQIEVLRGLLADRRHCRRRKGENDG